MDAALKNMLEMLRANNSYFVEQYRLYLNDTAMRLYNKSELDSSDLEDLKDILTICNILYNDTDIENLPIEDGVYDLLLEKYRKYDPHFQVGAEVIHFKPSMNKDDGEYHLEKDFKQAITFVEFPESKFIGDIMIPESKFIDERDFAPIVPPTPEYITKRKHEERHSHPELVGTLDKAKFVYDKDAIDRGSFNDSNVRIVERDFFRPHIEKGIISIQEEFDIVLELKYDGVSIEADCTDEVVSARSRGDTGTDQAADFTPILKGYKFPHRSPDSPCIGVKFEAIITQYDLQRFNEAKQYQYKNCRSAIVGLLASSDAWKYRDFITLVPLAVEQEVYETVCGCDRVKEIEFLNREFVSKGCPLRYSVVRGNYLENLAWIKLFTENADFSRQYIPFMYDGIVLSYRDEAKRRLLGRENFINKFSIAVKFNPLKKTTVFRGYSFTVGQDGSITPMIHYDPVEFYGTIHDKSSGHSLARFKELNLHKGDIINVEYVNEVMPYVSKPIANDINLQNEKILPPEQFPINCPICGMQISISNSGRSASCTNPNCGGRQLARMVNMCAKLDLEGFGPSTIDALGCKSLKQLVELLTAPNANELLAERGFGPVESSNMIVQINNLMTKPMEDSKLLGAIGFTSISTKTFEIILNKVNLDKLRELFNILDPSGYYNQVGVDYMKAIRGVGPLTAERIAKEWKYFSDDIEYMVKNANIIPYVQKVGKKICFSGFRDKNLIDYLESLGFSYTNNVTKDVFAVLVADTSTKSAKTQSANKFGIMIVPAKDFVDNLEQYL